MRVAIVGLPGSGKTSLSARLADTIRKRWNTFVPRIQGDHVLPQNIGAVAESIEGAIVEHLDVCMFLLSTKKRTGRLVRLDVIIRLVDSPAACMERCKARKNHGIPSIEFRHLDQAISEHIQEYMEIEPRCRLVTLEAEKTGKLLADEDARSQFISETWKMDYVVDV